ncbi:hypothetical protein Q3G72_029310 [Acer saccharum]|nr:hypothetical protein Q3G72_029310 [Acer saccharum]
MAERDVEIKSEAENNEEIETIMEVEKKLNEKKFSWAKLRRVDSLNLEAGRIFGSTHPAHSSNVSFSGVVFPALLAAYCGQAAYLMKFPGDVKETFYKSIPGSAENAEQMACDDQPIIIPHSTQLMKGSTVHVEVSLQQQAAASRVSSGSIRSFNAANSTNSSNRVVSGGVQQGGDHEEEMQFLERAKEKGVVYLLGEAQVVAQPNSSFLKKMIVNYGYSFLRKNFRQVEKVLEIPQTRLLRVGMTYEI